MSATILTYGYRLNGYESEVIRQHTAHLPDTLVVNACAVTLQAERDARQAIARAHRARPGRPIVPELPRLRLSSLDPAAFDDDLWTLIATEPRLMPHLHLSIQAGSDLILKRVRRRHLVDDAAKLIAQARRCRPGIAIGADLIAGFPTETDALFEETLGFVRDTATQYLHVFRFSERFGTLAARMPQVLHQTRRTRAALLRQAGAQAAASFHAALVGSYAQVVIERAGPDSAHGHTRHCAPIQLPGAWPHASLHRVRITAAGSEGLVAAAPDSLLAQAA